MIPIIPYITTVSISFPCSFPFDSPLLRGILEVWIMIPIIRYITTVSISFPCSFPFDSPLLRGRLKSSERLTVGAPTRMEIRVSGLGLRLLRLC